MTPGEYISKLNKAPLLEAILEVRWEIETSEEKIVYDPGFELAQGVFESKISQELPYYRRLGPAISPQAYHTVHQFWKGAREWPVVQLGPGIMTINDTGTNYEWNASFKPLIFRSIEALNQSYKSNIRYNFFLLRYINALAVPKESSFYSLIEDVLQIKIEKKFGFDGSFDDFALSETYALPNESRINLTVNSGANIATNQQALIWQISVIKNTGLRLEEINSWVEESHLSVSSLFRKIVSQKYYDSFKL